MFKYKALHIPSGTVHEREMTFEEFLRESRAAGICRLTLNGPSELFNHWNRQPDWKFWSES